MVLLRMLAGGVAKGHEDAPPREGVDRDVHGGLAYSIHNTLDAFAVGDLHHLLRDVDAAFRV